MGRHTHCHQYAISMLQIVKRAVKSALSRTRCRWPSGAHTAVLTAPSRCQAPDGAPWRFARPGGGGVGTPLLNNCTNAVNSCSCYLNTLLRPARRAGQGGAAAGLNLGPAACFPSAIKQPCPNPAAMGRRTHHCGVAQRVKIELLRAFYDGAPGAHAGAQAARRWRQAPAGAGWCLARPVSDRDNTMHDH